ncbi:TonB-dependent receptor [Phenylobacterium kunshanense]|uniref:TonB-dependent receptor n=1 Tax=Phenylobacterium kunshanense TaxID=1445034 RepID=A0A328BL15_9CAUL|nr:TonB-dependent receptor [Phenylobacterium kunshanense]RAK67803.1 TonB-dependent receptor [Phenylobacterium kunshanense]
MFEAYAYQVARRWAWLASAACLIAGAAQAQTYAVSLKAKGLEPALIGLATQTRQQIMFSKSVVAGRRAPAVQGQMTAEQALERLLAGTDLRARRVNASLVVVERAPPEQGDAAGARPFDVAEGPVGDNGAGAPAEPSPVGLVSAPPAPVPSEPTLLDEVRVTGSHIRGTRSASPLMVMDRDDLERSGHATVAGALAALPQAFATGASEGTLTTGSDRIVRNVNYGASVNLRGLGPDATLILVNGRRLSGSGSFGDFADISSIPSAAVERVELLLDGASALYGADAVGGVVNTILRKDVEGAETRAYAGVGTAGEPAQVQLSQTFGRQWTGGGVFVALEYQKRNALRAEDRDYTASADLRPLGGSDWRATNSFPGNILGPDPVTGALVPRWAIPAGQDGVGLSPSDFIDGRSNLQNQRAGIDTLPRQVLQSVFLTAHQELGGIEFTGDVRYAFRKYAVRTAGNVTRLTVNRANPFFVSPDGSASHSIAYSLQPELGNPLNIGSAETWAASLGAKAPLFGDWLADGYLGFGQEISESDTTGVLQTLYLSEALGTTPDRPETAFNVARDGYFNPFSGRPGANSAAVLDFIGSGFSSSRIRIRSWVASGQADGTLLRLPGGAVKLALGAQARRETLVRSGSNFAFTAAPSPQISADVARETLSAFGELRVPLVGDANRRPGVEALELSLAGRVERYDDVGTTANPKVGVLWRPTEDLTVRGTYGRSFRAPALREVHDPSSASSLQLSQADGARVRVLVLGGGNEDLEPETANAWTFGADYRPSAVPGLALGFTAFDIAFRNRIDRPVQQNAAAALIDPTLSPFVQNISPATNAADRALIVELLARPGTLASAAAFPPEAFAAIVDNRYVNTTTLRVRGVDVTAGYRFSVGGDEVALGLNGTYMVDYKQQVTPTSAPRERVGVAGSPVKLRARATVDWTHDRLTLGAAFNYVDRYRDVAGTRISAQPTVDLQARLAAPDRGFARGVSVSLTVRNLFDEGPPFYDNPVGIGYDPTNAEPVGRFAAIQITRAW